MTYDEQTEIINAAVNLHMAKPQFRIDISNNGLKKLKKWLKQNNITDYQIVELFAYIAFDHHKDAVIFRISHDNELLERRDAN